MSEQRTIKWFSDSPDAGHPDCVCSWCGEWILVPDDCEDPDDILYELSDDNPPIRMWNVKNQEARFHTSCYAPAIESAGLRQVVDESRKVKVMTTLGEIEVSPMVLLEPGEEIP
jgi:hypothetical protein